MDLKINHSVATEKKAIAKSADTPNILKTLFNMRNPGSIPYVSAYLEVESKNILLYIGTSTPTSRKAEKKTKMRKEMAITI